jgi:hypothetical protein
LGSIIVRGHKIKGEKVIGGDSMELDRTNHKAFGETGKIRHAYIIYIDRPESIEYANECARSCEQYGLPYTLWKGVENAGTCNLDEETGFHWVTVNNEMGCTASHLKLWRVIAEQPHACCVFEHDAILKDKLYDTEIPDNKLVMLGYRVNRAEDYERPADSIKFMDINKFEGTHAYAITPAMARYMIDRMQGYYTTEFGGVNTTIDGILSIHDSFGIARCVMDPPPVVCVVGDRNASVSPGFMKGLKAEPLRITAS